MSVKVLHAGLLTTIQDTGRFGSQKYGVIVSGAMDSYSSRLANILVGNNEHEATFEITLYGTTLEFNEDTLMAITGGDFQATLDGVIVPLWRPIVVKKESILKFNSAIKGSRAYIAFAGGIDTPLTLGSKSTYLRANIGGFKGRAIQKGDIIPIGKTDKELIRRLEKNDINWSINFNELICFKQDMVIRMLKGTEFDRFDKVNKQTLLQNAYTLTVQSDRMGYRLDGPPISMAEKFELLSEGVTFGTIQIPPNGQPIILMADRQTTGGYPKIGQVITADLPSLAQLQPTAQIRFKEVTLEEAETIFVENELAINNIKTGIHYKLFH
ncbi:biotin-dependent carboxyltransferase family protein [Psychrobacillus soli]|uniref:Biotin-dependent carboxyltransferase family protein n=1 Tax=Psychrobacillus soli TaxID=1543965 RepID=A0A544SRH1_9BACI|nr:biotin-dependent carboxyltransferase family protein [Psychrobacillus soli]TQR07781.1 biotin-dependent carboxyltransferase family protein [Psychrobacillus soli]